MSFEAFVKVINCTKLSHEEKVILTIIAINEGREDYYINNMQDDLLINTVELSQILNSLFEKKLILEDAVVCKKFGEGDKKYMKCQLKLNHKKFDDLFGEL